MVFENIILVFEVYFLQYFIFFFLILINCQKVHFMTKGQIE